MEIINAKLAEELKQKQAITDNLVKKILNSKRLLVDHVEALDLCVSSLTPQNSIEGSGGGGDGVGVGVGENNKKEKSLELITARNACIILGSTLVEHFLTPRSLRFTLLPSILVAGGFGTLYAVKNVFKFRNKIVESEVDNLIRTIDDFGNCIRRNMTYFNEVIIMKQHELIESRQIERAWDCITAAKEVTEILFDATRKMELQYTIPGNFLQYYSPMEELRDCEYYKNNVTDYHPKHIKDFHNIFAYVQSQFLFRLALTILTKPSISKLNTELVKITCQIHQLVQEENEHFRNLVINLNMMKNHENDALNTTKAMENRNGPIAVLQDSSLKLSARMVAVAGECQALDTSLQRLTVAELENTDNSSQLVQVANTMHSIENTLSVCFDDFQRLMLVYSRFLSSKLDNKHNSQAGEDVGKLGEGEEFPESFLRVEISQNQIDAQKSDDFYAYMFDEQQNKLDEQRQREEDDEQLKRSANELEILNFEKRITKGKFRPVLKQLKNRIDPIRKEMLIKEREVLLAKGINVDELFGKQESDDDLKESKTNKHLNHSNHVRFDDEQSENGDDDCDSEGSADLEFQARSKKLKERDNFEEMRNFLAQKQAINVYQLNLPTPPSNATGNEDILESEC